jgi:hypothetical protein
MFLSRCSPRSSKPTSRLALDLVVHLLGDQDTAWIGDPFQPDSNVGPFAVEVTVLPNDNVSNVEPDA